MNPDMDRADATVAAPLTWWDDGSIRISGSRVPIDAIVHHFNLGCTAEEIVYKFPSLLLAQVYGAIYYYLTHKHEIGKYLQEREARAEETREMIESSPLAADRKGIRERLLARAMAGGLLSPAVKQR